MWNAIATILAVCGCVTGGIFFIAHGLIVYKLYKDPKSISQTSAMGMFTTYISCLLWMTTILSLDPKENEGKDFPEYKIFFYNNIIGVFFDFCWNAIYIYYFTLNKSTILRIVYYITFVDITFEAIFYLMDSFSEIKADNGVRFSAGGWIACGFNVLMHITPGLNIAKLFKEKNRALISFPNVVLGLLNSGFWLVFACIKKKTYSSLNNDHMIVANSCGILLCLIQLCMYKCFKEEVSKNDIQMVKLREEKVEAEPEEEPDPFY